MKISFKYGVSAIALLAAISLAQAQTSERQGGGASGSEHSMGGRGGERSSAQGGAERSGASQNRSAAKAVRPASIKENRQSSASSQHQGKSRPGRSKAPRLNTKEQGSPGNAAQEAPRVQRAQQRGAIREQEHGQQSRAEPGPRNRADREREGGQVRPSADAEQGQGERSAKTERENRGTQGEESRGRETELGGARGNEARRPGPAAKAIALPAFRANKRPGFTASWFATPQSIAITARMWISRSRSGPGFRTPSNFTIRRRKSCRSIRSSRATRSWCSTT